MPIVLLKYGSWGAAGVLIGIAVAVWAGPETAAGFIIIIVIGLLATIVARGLVQWLLSMLRKKPQEGEGEDDEKTDEKETAETEKPKVAEKVQDGKES